MRYAFGVGLLCLAAFAAVYAALIRGPIALDQQHIGLNVQLPVLAILGIMALLASLALVSLAFSLADLTDRTQALGLPEGSVRAVIALSLIVLFAITSVYFHETLVNRGLHESPPLTSDEATEFVAGLRPEEFVQRLPIGVAGKEAIIYRLGTQGSDDFATVSRYSPSWALS